MRFLPQGAARAFLPFCLFATAAQADCNSDGTLSAIQQPDADYDQIGPGPGHEMPVLATYAVALCVDADTDGRVAFALDAGTRIGMVAQACDGTNEECGDGAHVCCRPVAYVEGFDTWPAELSTDANDVENVQTVTVQCDEGDDYIRLTYLVAQGEPSQYSNGAP